MAKRSMHERLAHLEKQMAQIRVGAIEATEFRLVDGQGRVRAVLHMTRTGPRLAFFGEDGKLQAQLESGREGPGLTLADDGGHTRAWLGVTKNAARLGVADADGNQRLFLGVMPSGPKIKLYDKDQRETWSPRGGAVDKEK